MNNPHYREPIEVKDTMDSRAWRPLFLVFILGVIVLALTFVSCVTAQDTQAYQESQQRLEQRIVQLQQQQAAGSMTPQEVNDAMKAALAAYAEDMKKIGKDVQERTGSIVDALKDDPVGGGLTLLLSQLPGLFALNTMRNRSAKKKAGGQ